jgi:hypothetical protein
MMEISREELLMKLGAARDQSCSAWRLVVIKVAADSASFSYRLDRNKLRQARSREGRYLLRTNLIEEDPAKLWSHYLLLVAVEEAFKNLKSLPLRKQGATSRSGQSFTSSRPALRRTSSSPSWPIACTSLLRGACTCWRPGCIPSLPQPLIRTFPQLGSLRNSFHQVNPLSRPEDDPLACLDIAR